MAKPKYIVQVKKKTATGFYIHIGKTKYVPIKVDVKRPVASGPSAGLYGAGSRQAFKVYVSGRYYATVNAKDSSSVVKSFSSGSQVLAIIGWIYGRNILDFVHPFVFQEYEYKSIDDDDDGDSKQRSQAKALAKAQENKKKKEQEEKKKLQKQMQWEISESERLAGIVFREFWGSPDLIVRLYSIIQIKGPVEAGEIINQAVRLKNAWEKLGIASLFQIYDPFSPEGTLATIQGALSLYDKYSTYLVRTIDGRFIYDVAGVKGLRYGNFVVLTEEKTIGANLGSRSLDQISRSFSRLYT